VWAVRPELPPGPLRIAPQNAAPAINIVGILVYNAANNCFLLDWGGGFTQPLVWPAGTSPASDGVGVVLANGHVVRAGDLVKGRGRNRQVADAWGIPKACRSRDGGVLLLQSL